MVVLVSIFWGTHYPQHGARTHDPEMKSRTLFWLSQPGVPMLNFLRKRDSVSHSGCTHLQIHQRSPLTVPPIEHNFLFSTFWPMLVISGLLDNNHSDRCHTCQPITLGFDLNFPGDKWWWTSLHVFFGHLCVFFGKNVYSELCWFYNSYLFLCYCVVCVLQYFGYETFIS